MIKDLRTLLRPQEHVRLAAPEPEVLRVIGEDSKKSGTDKLTTREIDRIIKATRVEKAARE